MRALATLLTILLVLPAIGPARAGTEDHPEIVDTCGLDSPPPVGEADENAPPWADVCRGWFETLSGEQGPPAIRLTLEYADDITTRPLQTRYQATFDLDGCRYMLLWEGTGRLTVTCDGDMRPVECPPYDALITCSETIPTVEVVTADGVVVEDENRLVITLVMAGALAGQAGAFQTGARLTNVFTVAHGFNGASAGTMCVGGLCKNPLGDRATGEDYVIEPGAGPAVTGPVNEGEYAPGCVSGPATEGSADAPHFLDPRGDVKGTVSMRTPDGDRVHLPTPEGEAYDVRAAWFDSTGDGIAVSIQPWGTSHVQGELGYLIVLNGWMLSFISEADGTWSGILEPDGPGTHDVVAEANDHEVVDVDYDPDTGVVSMSVPSEVLGDGDLLPDHISSRYMPYGTLASASTVRTDLGMDYGSDGHLCVATR